MPLLFLTYLSVFSILTEWLHCVKNRIHILNEEIGEIAGLTLNEVNY